jgi:hypothetical protein
VIKFPRENMKKCTFVEENIFYRTVAAADAVCPQFTFLRRSENSLFINTKEAHIT